MRVEQIKDDLFVFQMTEQQYRSALGHPIFMQVLRLALTANPPKSFWEAQYEATIAQAHALDMKMKNTT